MFTCNGVCVLLSFCSIQKKMCSDRSAKVDSICHYTVRTFPIQLSNSGCQVQNLLWGHKPPVHTNLHHIWVRAYSAQMPEYTNQAHLDKPSITDRKQAQKVSHDRPLYFG